MRWAFWCERLMYPSSASPLSRITSISSPGLNLGLPSWSSTSASGSMPSDLAPISTTTWVAVSFSTVPLMTRSSLTASSASVVKFSSTEAKSSPRLFLMRRIVRGIVSGVRVRLLGGSGFGGNLIRFGLVLLFRRRFFSCDGGGGFGVVSGGLVEQGHASLMTDAGPALRTAG